MLDASRVRVVGLDADDTLWANELIFRDAERRIAALLAEYEVEHVVQREMYAVEMANLAAYGYGIKGFTLSMIELVLRVTGGRAPGELIAAVLEIGKGMLDAPVEVLPGVPDALEVLGAAYPLVVVTKGDLLDQRRKLTRSGLADRFHHVEVVSDKRPADYAEALARMRTAPAEFLMVGNSLRSDVLPLLELGAQAVHVPYHVTWEHEEAVAEGHHRYLRLESLGQLPGHLRGGAPT